MTPYKSLSGKQSGVTAYEIGDDFIKVCFRNNYKTYKYTVSLNGQYTIDKMKALALASQGLSTFIAQHKAFLKFTY